MRSKLLAGLLACALGTAMTTTGALALGRGAHGSYGHAGIARGGRVGHSVARRSYAGRRFARAGYARGYQRGYRRGYRQGWGYGGLGGYGVGGYGPYYGYPYYDYGSGGPYAYAPGYAYTPYYDYGRGVGVGPFYDYAPSYAYYGIGPLYDYAPGYAYTVGYTPGIYCCGW